jgi:outer membrane protein
MTMTKSFRNLMLVVLTLGLMSSSAFAQGRIGTVDLRRLFDNYWKTKQADAALKDRAADLDKEYKGLRDEYAKSKEDLQKLIASANDLAVSDAERDKRKKTADGKLKDLKDTEETIVQFEKQARTTLDEQRRRMRDNILGEIRTLVNAKAKSGGFTLVIDIAAESANNTPVVLYTNGENDLTPAILDQLNLGAPAEPAKPAEKPAAKATTDKPAEKKQ